VSEESNQIQVGDAPAFENVATALGLGMAFQLHVPVGGTGRRFTYVSENCLELNGVTAEQVLADPATLYGMILPEAREAYDRAEGRAIEGPGRFEVEVRMLVRGEVRWRRVTAARRVLADGSSLWDGLVSDITEAKLAAEESDKQRWRLAVAVEATGLGFWQWNPRTHEIVWSARNKALFGLPPDAPVTIEHYLAMIHPDDLERCLDIYRGVRDGASAGGDFAMDYRAVMPNGQMRWIRTHGRIISDADGPALVVGTTVDNTERREAEERRNLVMSELAHRAKNGLQVMMAIIKETGRSAADVKGFEAVLMARLQALADAQDLVTAAGGGPVPLTELAARALTPFGLTRFDMELQTVTPTVHGDVAGGLALLLHEMATNAVKYGALSRPEGRIVLRAEDAGPGMAALHWSERGGPLVEATNRRGFGSKLLQAALRQHGGKVEPAFLPEGFSARMEFRIAG
jgi:two-component sensor histidine kinase